MNRRTFFLAGGSAMLAAAAPSDRLTAGLIGSGGRGQLVMKLFQQDPSVRIAAVCDVYEPNLESGLSAAGPQAKAYRNYKALLDDKSIDAVIIATPEHWHHRMLLDAVAAGKDVYIEKPLCQTPEQGVEMIDAVHRSKSIVQVGTQRRSYDLYLRARETMRSGALGKVRMVRSWWLNNALGSREYKLNGKLDWEQWQGPARRHALDPARFYDWRSYSDYSGGIVADQGAHVFDGIHMLTGAVAPIAVTASAGRIHRPAVDTPESVTVTAEYPEDFIATFSINYAAMKYKLRNDQLNQYDGDLARLDIGREQFIVVRRGEEEQPPPIRETSGGYDVATAAHVRNFLDCVRTRSTPNAPVEVGVQGCLIVQLANMSLRSGRRIKWNAALRKVEA